LVKFHENVELKMVKEVTEYWSSSVFDLTTDWFCGWTKKCTSVDPIDWEGYLMSIEKNYRVRKLRVPSDFNGLNFPRCSLETTRSCMYVTNECGITGNIFITNLYIS
jgi:allantoicase